MLRDKEQNPSVRSGWLIKGIVNIKRAEKNKKSKNKIVENLLDFSTIISICIITIKYFEEDTVWLVLNLILKQSVFDTCVSKLKELKTRKLVQVIKELWKIVAHFFRLWEANVVTIEETGTEQRNVFHYLAVTGM